MLYVLNSEFALKALYFKLMEKSPPGKVSS